MRPPNDTRLPFFAYGLFKHDQLCFFRIKDFVETIDDGKISGILKERDGLPLLVASADSNVRGNLIYFFNDKCDIAYQHIIEIEPDEQYYWSTITVNNLIEANVLIGKSPNKGCADIEHCEEWDGREDPLFKQGLDEVNAILIDESKRSIFRYHMAYSLLWTIIERYAGLKYHLGKKVNEKVFQIAKESSFKESLKKNVTEKRSILSAADLANYKLDPDDPDSSIKYYYQVRSNSIHRGKVARSDYRTLKSSSEELLNIFTDVLCESFKR